MTVGEIIETLRMVPRSCPVMIEDLVFNTENIIRIDIRATHDAGKVTDYTVTLIEGKGKAKEATEGA